MRAPSLTDEILKRAVTYVDRRGGAAMRRGGRGRGSVTKAPSLLPKVLPIFAGGSVFLADRHLVDGTSGKVYGFQDLLDPTHYLIQATGTKQVALPTSYAKMRGALCATFAGGQGYVTTRAASAFKHLHDGTGCTWAVVYAKTADVVGSRVWSTTSAAPGSDFMSDNPTAGTARSRVFAGGFANVGAMNAVGALALDTPCYLSGSYKEGASPEMTLHAQGTLVASMNSLIAPAAGNPGGTFTLGASPGVTSDFARMQFRALLLAAPGKILTAAERTIVQQWIQQDAGIAP